MTRPQALIVEDNELNSEVLQILLDRQGVESISTSSPGNVMILITTVPNIRIVFLDLEFPNTNGFDIFEQLTQHPDWNSAIRIIAYSVNTKAFERVRQAGFNGFLGKPIHPDKFPEQLEKILAGELVWSLS